MSCGCDENNNYEGEIDVTKSLKVRLYPNKKQKKSFDQNIANRGFIWNRLLEKCKYEDVEPTDKNLNKIVMELKEEYPFVGESESSSRQQVYRDLIQAIKKHKNEGAGYPKFKTQKNPNTSFRIQCNNNIHLIEGKNRIQVPTIGKVKFKTSKEYKQLLRESKINNMTIKYENGIYMASINIDSKHKILKKPKKEGLGIDLGIRRPATCSNKLKIHPIDLNKEENNIKYYQREMSKRKPGSIRYRNAQDKYRKWMRKKINKKNDKYHKFTHYLVKNYNIIGLETLNVRGWFKNGRWAPKLQKTSVYEIVRQLKYKAKWNNRTLKQVGRFFPSSQLCSECYYKNEDLKMGDEEWDCPECNAHHDRDLNASATRKSLFPHLISEINHFNPSCDGISPLETLNQVIGYEVA